MSARLTTVIVAALVAAASFVPRPAADNAPRSGIDWPSFRGTNARGIGDGFPTPVKWSVSAAENVRWKTLIPGLSHSSPIVWGNLVCTATAIGGQENLRVGLYGDIAPVQDVSAHTWKVLCLDKRSGKPLWDRVAHAGVPKIKRHPKSTHASSTLATDGQHIVAFLGSEGLYCFDMNGVLRWRKDLGVRDSGFYMVPDVHWGSASSPIIFEDRVIIQSDVQKDSYVAAFDIKDGREIWRTPRHDVPTFSTPTVHSGGGRALLVVNGYKHIGGYDARTGKELWRLTGGGDIPVPTPVVANDLIFVTNAHGKMAPIYAIKPDATGDISLGPGETTNAHIVWSQTRDGAYMQTPLVYRDYLYNARDNGVLSVYEATSGRRVYQQRLGDGTTGFSASPVAADGKVYYTSEDGDVYVIKAGPVFELLAVNHMDEVCMATPAISEGALFFRTKGHLVAIGGSKARQP